MRQITDYLNDDSKAYFNEVKTHLDDLGISYVEDLTLYVVLIITHTAFELMMDNPNMMVQ